MKKAIRITLILLLLAFIAIQFVRPPKNISNKIEVNDISTVYNIPDSVQNILKVSCYDCHSNNTLYPWYWQIQPVTWFMNSHIEDGKKHLNFSGFTSYSIRRQYKLFENIKDEVKQGEMPLTSYTFIHKDAVLDATQKKAIETWTQISRNKIENQYPPDSLKAAKNSRANKF